MIWILLFGRWRLHSMPRCSLRQSDCQERNTLLWTALHIILKNNAAEYWGIIFRFLVQSNSLAFCWTAPRVAHFSSKAETFTAISFYGQQRLTWVQNRPESSLCHWLIESSHVSGCRSLAARAEPVWLMPVSVGENSIAVALALDMALMFVLVGAIIERLVSVAVSLWSVSVRC